MAEKFYVTTAIDYVNAEPHIGHAYEKVLADVLARWHRLLGKKVFFLTGTDENASKNALAAKAAGVPTQEFVDKNSETFVGLCEKLDLSNDDFIRTTQKRHVDFATSMFKKISDAGDIYKGKYEGHYCEGCEEFKTEKGLVEGKCPEHDVVPKVISEDAYFFRLSRFKDRIIKLIEDGLVVPPSRANEMLSRLKNDELRDLCVSRAGIDWGIPSPVDPDFKIYVWIDALSNYLSALGPDQKVFWPADVHVIGKGINWFHSVIWPALLLSAGYDLPSKVWVHGYLTVDGRKMSKSLGNVVNPVSLLKSFSVDSLRYFLVRDVPFGSDGDFSVSVLVDRHNHELADKLGNLVSRVSALAEKHGLSECDTSELSSSEVFSKVSDLFVKFDVDKALNEIFGFVDSANEFVQGKKPWSSECENPSEVLFVLANAIKDVAILLSPFIPGTSKRIGEVFNFNISLDALNKPLGVSKVKKAPVLFKKVDASVVSSVEEKVMVSKSDVSAGKVPFEDFARLDLRVGKVLEVSDHPSADKLFVLSVDLGEESPRTIVAGLKGHYDPADLVGERAIFVANLLPVKLRGVESNGMILAASSSDKSKVVILTVESDLAPGSKVS